MVWLRGRANAPQRIRTPAQPPGWIWGYAVDFSALLRQQWPALQKRINTKTARFLPETRLL